LNYAIVFIGSLGQILLQFAMQWILAERFGTAVEMDAYMAALTLPIAASALLAGGIGPLIVTATHRRPEEDQADSPIGLLIFGTIALAVAMATVCLMLSQQLMSRLHPGFDAAMTDRAAALFRILVWVIPANTAIGLFQAALNGRQQFAIPALAGVLGPMSTVVIILVAAPTLGIAAVAWGTLTGAILNVVVQGPSLRKHLPKAGLRAAARACRELVPLAIPIFLGMFLLKVDPLVDRYVSSYLDEGSISRYGYATRIVTIFIMLASGTLSTVSFPRIAGQAAQGKDALVAAISQAFRMLLTLTLPAVVVLLCFSEPLVRDLFERGAFTPADTAAVAALMRISTLLLIGAACGELITKTFYVLKDSRTPTVLGAILLIGGAILKFSLVRSAGINALAAISSGTTLTGGVLLTALLVRRLGQGIFDGMPVHLAKCLAATAAAAGIGMGAMSTKLPFAAVLGLGLGGAVYFVILGAVDRRTRDFLFHVWHESVRQRIG